MMSLISSNSVTDPSMDRAPAHIVHEAAKYDSIRVARSYLEVYYWGAPDLPLFIQEGDIT